MPWFRVDDGLPDHRKVRRLGRDKAPAIGVWTLCGAWSSGNQQDGFVPKEIVQRFDPREKYAARLVEVGLWLPDEVDGEDGYRFHDWADQNPTRVEIEARRESTRTRVQRYRQRRQAADQHPDDPGPPEPDPDDDPGNRSLYDSSNSACNALHDSGNALQGEGVTGPRAQPRAGAHARVPTQPNPTHTQPSAANAALRASRGRAREHPAPAALNATAASVPAYRVVADWAARNPHVTTGHRRKLNRAVDDLLAQGADIALMSRALDIAHAPPYRNAVASLANAYEDARRERVAPPVVRHPVATTTSRVAAALAHLRPGED